MSKQYRLQPTTQIIANLGIDVNGRVQKFFANTCYRYMDKYVPMDTGNLRTVVSIGNDYIDYEMPYAYYQYVGHREDGSHQVKNYTTAGTGPYWDQRMWSVEQDNVVKEVQAFIERG